MEVVKQWPVVGIEAEEVEDDVSLQKNRFRQGSNAIKTHEDSLLHRAQSFNDAEDTESSYGSSGSVSPKLIISDLVSGQRTEKIENFDIDEKVLPPLFNGNGKQVSFSNNGRVELRKEIEKEVGELYLEKVYEKPGSHNFYCPNCNSCITKVIIRDRESETSFVSERPSAPAHTFRCTSCFTFLIPIGNWFFPKLVSPLEEDPIEQETEYYGENRGVGPTKTSQKSNESIVFNYQDASINEDPNVVVTPKTPEPVLGDGGSMQNSEVDAKKETRISIIEDFRVGTVAHTPESMEIQYDQENPAEFKTKDPSSDQKVSNNPTGIEILTPAPALALAPLEAVIIDREKKLDEISEEKGPVSVTDTSGITETLTVLEPSRESKRWQVVKSIVYGGLAESITSLGIVTSAASADAKTVDILVLALANLIGGLFVIAHNLKDLKDEQFRRSKNETEEQLNRYEETLGNREHIALHFSVVILSFLVFGLIPPLVYGLSFRQSDNRDFKLAAVACASFLCISLLALGKAHIQKPSKWHKYITVVIYYLGIGIGVSCLSYLAGYLIGKLIDKLGWFKSSSDATLLLPRTSFSEPAFRSY